MRVGAECLVATGGARGDVRIHRISSPPRIDPTTSSVTAAAATSAPGLAVARRSGAVVMDGGRRWVPLVSLNAEFNPSAGTPGPLEGVASWHLAENLTAPLPTGAGREGEGVGSVVLLQLVGLGTRSITLLVGDDRGRCGPRPRGRGGREGRERGGGRGRGKGRG
jgi:hypothetical protein